MSRSGVVVPRLMVNPALPASVQELLREAEPAQLRAAVSAEFTSPWWGLADPLGGRRVRWWFAGLLLSVFARSPAMAGACACAYGLTAAVAVLNRRRRLSVLHRIAAVQDDFVLSQNLTAEAGELLARSSRAAARIQKSSVQRLDPRDKQHTDDRLDVQVWEIADALRTYSAVAERGPKEAVSEVVEQALESRRKALRISLSSIERRVEALETYAARIAEAEQRLRELRQLQQLVTGAEELFDLLAATARDDHAVAEIEGMSDEASRALDLYNEAVQAAQAAAELALPDPTEASTRAGDRP